MKNNPNAENDQLRSQFSESNWNSVRTYKSQFFNKIQEDNKSEKAIEVFDISDGNGEVTSKEMWKRFKHKLNRELKRPNPEPYMMQIAFRFFKESGYLEEAQKEGRVEEWTKKEMSVNEVVDTIIKGKNSTENIKEKEREQVNV